MACTLLPFDWADDFTPLELQTCRAVGVQQLVALAGLCPRVRHLELTQQHVIDRGAHLSRARIEANPADARAKPRYGDRVDVVRNSLTSAPTTCEAPAQDKEEHSAGCKVSVG